MTPSKNQDLWVLNLMVFLLTLASRRQGILRGNVFTQVSLSDWEEFICICPLWPSFLHKPLGDSRHPALFMEGVQMCIFLLWGYEALPRPCITALGGSSALAFSKMFKEGERCCLWEDADDMKAKQKLWNSEKSCLKKREPKNKPQFRMMPGQKWIWIKWW